MNERARILVVAGEKPECDELRYLLEGEGYEVDQALCGTEALGKIERRQFDLILAEIPVPDVDGLEMLWRIREVHPHAVMIAMGGDAAFEAAIEAWQCDISGYVSRPFDDPGEVLAAVIGGLAERSEMPVSATIPGVPVPPNGEARR